MSKVIEATKSGRRRDPGRHPGLIRHPERVWQKGCHSLKEGARLCYDSTSFPEPEKISRDRIMNGSANCRRKRQRDAFATIGRRLTGRLLAAGLALWLTGSARTAVPARIEFNRDVRPILSENCFSCHGPDENQRKANLRLDLRDSAFKPAKSGDVPIVPGVTASSALVRRIFSSDPAEQMPPAKSNRALTDAQKET